MNLFFQKLLYTCTIYKLVCSFSSNLEWQPTALELWMWPLILARVQWWTDYQWGPWANSIIGSHTGISLGIWINTRLEWCGSELTLQKRREVHKLLALLIHTTRQKCNFPKKQLNPIFRQCIHYHSSIWMMHRGCFSCPEHETYIHYLITRINL